MNKNKVGIISCGIGNTGSVYNMLRKVNAKPDIINDPSYIKRYDKLIFPGVGNFGEALHILKSKEFLLCFFSLNLINEKRQV